MKKNNPVLSLIIVNLNGNNHLEELLPTIKNQSYQNFEIILVDNYSSDNSKKTFLRYFPKGIFILLDKNYGFARPNNVGFKKSRGKYLVTLNNDLVLDKDFLLNAVEFIKNTNDDVFAIGCKIINYYNRNIIDTIGIKPLSNGGGINIGKGEPINKFKKTINIYGPCAGAAIYKKEIIQKIGFFDESYFAYLEDLDLAHRAQKNGYKSLYCPNSVCYHKHSATSSKRPFFKLYLIERNRLFNLWKHYPHFYIFIELFYTTYFVLKNFLKPKNKFNISKSQKSLFSFKNIGKLLVVIIKSRTDFIKWLIGNQNPKKFS